MKLILPLFVTLQRKTKDDKKFILNLNIYRNTHHFTLNNAKAAWKQIVADAVNGRKINYPFPLHFVYTVYPESKRAFDLGNVLPIIQKFTDDALIELGIIPDDSFKYIGEISYLFGGQDKENPRAELEIFTQG